MTPLTTLQSENSGYIYGFLGVLGFSLTLPATRAAVTGLDPVFVGLGRSLVAAALAAGVLLSTRQRFPARKHLPGLMVVAAGVVIGFPLLSAWAMRRVPASHGAVVTGLLPLATALAGTWRGDERPSQAFWAAGIAGSCVVLFFSFSGEGRGIESADVALMAAVVAAALGYAEGGRLARILGGWQVICWSLLLSVPFIFPPVILSLLRHGCRASSSAWIGFGYLSVVSMFLSFFAWYRGLALGGIARVGQVQLLQPFLTMLASSFLLGEVVTLRAMGAALAVVGCVALGRKAKVLKAGEVRP